MKIAELQQREQQDGEARQETGPGTGVRYGGGVVCRKVFLSETQPMKRVISVAVGARTSISRLLHSQLYEFSLHL